MLEILEAQPGPQSWAAAAVAAAEGGPHLAPEQLLGAVSLAQLFVMVPNAAHFLGLAPPLVLRGVEVVEGLLETQLQSQQAQAAMAAFRAAVQAAVARL